MAKDKKIEDKKELNKEDLKEVAGGHPMGIALCQYCGHVLHPMTRRCTKCGRKSR